MRWKYGVPPVANAIMRGCQHILGHLAPNGTAGWCWQWIVVVAKRRNATAAMVEGDVVDCMIALPSQLSTDADSGLFMVPARNKNPGGTWRDRRGEVIYRCAEATAWQIGHGVNSQIRISRR
jgi:type I restriction enzyme M protein